MKGGFGCGSQTLLRRNHILHVPQHDTHLCALSPHPSSEPPLLPGKDQTSRECLDTRCSAVRVSLGRQKVPSSRHLWWLTSLAAQWNPIQEGGRPSRCQGLVEADPDGNES